MLQPRDAGANVPPTCTTLTTAEHVWDVEVDTMGYRAPLSDMRSTDHGPHRRLDIYVSNLGPTLYGYCTSDDPAVT